MNKQELIDYCNAIKENKSQFINCIDVNGIIKKIEQLDEPQKVTVPPEVSVWYQINKDNLDKNIAYLCLHNFGDFINDKTLFNWMSNTDNFIQILVNMHQFGYEVEKEPKYTVKIPVVNQYLVRVKDENFLGFLSSKLRTYFTRKEVEDAGFGWVFDCKGIEIEEVE